MYRNIMQPKVINGFFDDFLQSGLHKAWSEAGKLINEDFAPANIRETEKTYELAIVAPGLSKESFKVNVDKNVLTISYQRPEETNNENEGKWLRKEFVQPSFKRSFTLSDKTDATAGITAKYNDGILLLSIPKKEQQEPTTQEIVVN